MIIVLIALSIYIAMIFATRFRTPIAILGAATLLIYGTLSGTFPANMAFEKFPKEIIILIVVLALFSKVFESVGLFDYVEEKFSDFSKGKRILLIVVLVLVMYSVSMFMNNLSVILLFTFICLKLSIKYNLPIIPVLVGGIIASNIGGAALPWADTPAVILTLYTDFTLIDFLTKLFLPCAVYAILLAGYTAVWSKRLKNRIPIIKSQQKNHIKISEENSILLDKVKLTNSLNKKKFIIPISLFMLFIIGICIGPFLNLSIAYISMFFGGILLITSKQKPEDIINSLPILDSISFITALFLIGGVLEYSGVTKLIVEHLFVYTGESNILILLAILLSAFLIATFLSAGPAAATLLPICLQLNPIIKNNLVYVALALGILAGSSMLPWSATGGPIMLGEVNRFLKQYNIREKDRKRANKVFNLKLYTAFSIPFSLLILVLSGVFLSFYMSVF